MKSVRKILTVIIMMSVIVGALPMQALAAKKISSVSISITSHIMVGSAINSDAVEVTTKNSRYSVQDYQFTNSGFSWSEDDIPELEIELAAEDGYIFQLKANDVKVSGGTHVSSRVSSGNLIVKVKLPSLSEQTGAIENIYWTSNTIAAWDAAIGAGSYEVKLTKDGKTVGGTRQTAGTSYNFAGDMQSSGNYSFQVRPVNKLVLENKGEWREGPVLYIDQSTVDRLKNGGASWHQDQTGWWYRNLDGSYPANIWQLIGDKWYYFDTQGYMKTGWIEWNGAFYFCDETSGEMWADRELQDGGYVKSDGARVDAETWAAIKAEAKRQEEEAVSWDDWQSQWKDEND